MKRSRTVNVRSDRSAYRKFAMRSRKTLVFLFVLRKKWTSRFNIDTNDVSM